MDRKKTKEKYFCLLGQSIRDWKFWAKLLIGTAQITSIIVFLVVTAVFEDRVYAIAEHLSYFTTLSNLFCGIFFVYSAFFHHAEGKGKFNNSEIGKIAITYITLTIIVYNLNEMMAKNAYLFDSWKYTMSFFCEHSLVPLLAIIYFLFFYNHENVNSIKEFSKKWVWYMIAGLVIYLTLFSIIGFLARIFNWRPLFNTTDGSGQFTTFPYPFMDWYHGVGFFKNLTPWTECFVMLTATISACVIADYSYTAIILKLNKDNDKLADFNIQQALTMQIRK